AHAAVLVGGDEAGARLAGLHARSLSPAPAKPPPGHASLRAGRRGTSLSRASLPLAGLPCPTAAPAHPCAGAVPARGLQGFAVPATARPPLAAVALAAAGLAAAFAPAPPTTMRSRFFSTVFRPMP